MLVLRVKTESVDDSLLTTYMKSVGLVTVLPTLIPVVPETMTNEAGAWPVETVGVAESGVNGHMHAQLSDSAVERMPCPVWVGTPQERVE